MRLLNVVTLLTSKSAFFPFVADADMETVDGIKWTCIVSMHRA